MLALSGATDVRLNSREGHWTQVTRESTGPASTYRMAVRAALPGWRRVRAVLAIHRAVASRDHLPRPDDGDAVVDERIADDFVATNLPTLTVVVVVVIAIVVAIDRYEWHQAIVESLLADLTGDEFLDPYTKDRLINFVVGHVEREAVDVQKERHGRSSCALVAVHEAVVLADRVCEPHAESQNVADVFVSKKIDGVVQRAVHQPDVLDAVRTTEIIELAVVDPRDLRQR